MKKKSVHKVSRKSSFSWEKEVNNFFSQGADGSLRLAALAVVIICLVYSVFQLGIIKI